MIHKETKTTITCDVCGDTMKEKNDYLEIGLGGTNDVSHKARIKVEYEQSYRCGYGESDVCKKCKIMILEKILKRLQGA